MKQVGNVIVEVWEGYPVQILLRNMRDPNGCEVRFLHSDLRDLKHAIESAIREAASNMSLADAKRSGLDIST